MAGRTISIHEARPRDSIILYRLHNEMFPGEGWDENWFKKETQNPAKRIYVAKQDELPIGLMVISIVADEAEILTIGVAPRYRGLGAAKALLQQAYKLPIMCLFLEVAEDNAAALALYQSEGFIENGRRPNYYSSGADALIMIRDVSKA